MSVISYWDPFLDTQSFTFFKSSEYETDSEEEEDVKPAIMFRPVFVPK